MLETKGLGIRGRRGPPAPMAAAPRRHCKWVPRFSKGLAGAQVHKTSTMASRPSEAQIAQRQSQAGPRDTTPCVFQSPREGGLPLYPTLYPKCPPCPISAHNQGTSESAWTLEPDCPGSNPGPAPCYAKSLQSCPTLCDPIDSSPPGSPVPGILKARTLEWVAISFSNA